MVSLPRLGLAQILHSTRGGDVASPQVALSESIVGSVRVRFVVLQLGSPRGNVALHRTSPLGLLGRQLALGGTLGQVDWRD